MKHDALAAIAWILVCAAASHAAELPSARANDNRTPAGALKDGLLTLQLDIVEAKWFPEAEPGPSLRVYTFAERGRAPQVPGPLIRVPLGTKVRVNIRNGLPVAMFLRGLDSHQDGDAEPKQVAGGSTTEATFDVSKSGTYYYSARSTKQGIQEVGLLPVSEDLPMGEGPFEIESQLEGAFIVDPPDSHADDRIFVITDFIRGVINPPFREVPAINGKSWPYTERLFQRVGDTMHWRILNPSMSDHAVHLHGFYFQVNSLGDGERDRIYTSEESPHAVTQYLIQGATTSLTWAADRRGQWLFHCHMTDHMSPELSLVTNPLDAAQAAEHVMSEDSAGMAGLILGIKVAPIDGQSIRRPSMREPRKLRLLVRDKPATRFTPAGMGYIIQDAGARETAEPPPIPGAPLVLTRDEPVEITIVNQLIETTVVHWHGIELESYYDGVPGWSGESAQTTHPIPPGGTFVARMTPPRAGTFIYHTHWHDASQLVSGLYGPLIVVEPGEKFDAATDKIFIIGKSGPKDRHPLLLNGLAQPGPLTVHAGVRYRFRFINIATNDSDLSIALLADGKPVQWRALAKDGWTLPKSQATVRPAEQAITVGETYDFEFVPERRGELLLELKEAFLETRLNETIAVH